MYKYCCCVKVDFVGVPLVDNHVVAKADNVVAEIDIDVDLRLINFVIAKVDTAVLLNVMMLLLKLIML